MLVSHVGFNFEDFKKKIRIEDVAESLGIPLKGACPCHPEGKNCFSIDTGTQLFHCFHPSCEAGGDLFHLWALVNGGRSGLNWDEEIKKKSIKWTIDTFGTDEDRKAFNKPSVDESGLTYFTELEKLGRKFLRNKALRAKKANHIQEIWDYLGKRGYTDPLIEDSQFIILPSKKLCVKYFGEIASKTFISKWSDSITLAIPHFNVEGKVIGFKLRDYTGIKDPRFDSGYLKGVSKGESPCGLHLVTGDKVIVVEGSADYSILSPHFPVICTEGSEITVKQLEALKSKGIKNIVLSPDSDEAGKIGFLKTYTRLKEEYPESTVTAVPYSSYQGCKDPDELLVKMGCSLPLMKDFFDSAIDPSIGGLDAFLGITADELAERVTRLKKEKLEIIKGADKIKNEVIPLGSKGDSNYFYSTEHRTIYVRTPDHLKESWCTQMLSDRSYWLGIAAKVNEKTGVMSVDWPGVAASLQKECAKAGYYSPDSSIDIGVYREKGLLVVNLGTGLRIYKEGKWSSLTYEESLKNPILKKYIPASGDILKIGEEATLEEINTLKHILKLLPYHNSAPGKDKIDPFILEGICYTGMISGALDRRMHVSFTGEKSSGKSKILELIVAPMWIRGGDKSPKAFISAGSTSEAGVRQDAGKTDTAIIIDETESLDKSDGMRMAKILEAARSSYTGALVKKGTAGHKAVTFQQNSVYLLSSIDHPIKHAQDFDRFHIFNFHKKSANYALWNTETYPLIESLFTEDFGKKMFSRLLNRLPRILELEKRVQREIMLYTKVQRASDNYSPILACVIGMSADQEQIVSDEVVKGLVAKFMKHYALNDNSENLYDQTSHAEVKLSQITSVIITLDGSTRKSIYRLIRESIEGVWGYTESLEDYGILVKPDYIWFANKHPQLDSLVAVYGGADRQKSLLKLEGAVKDTKPKRFGGMTARCVGIPVSYFPKEEVA